MQPTPVKRASSGMVVPDEDTSLAPARDTQDVDFRELESLLRQTVKRPFLTGCCVRLVHVKLPFRTIMGSRATCSLVCDDVEQNG
jgi:hypothetical protein